jgi:rhomboid protease GluP
MDSQGRPLRSAEVQPEILPPGAPDYGRDDRRDYGRGLSAADYQGQGYGSGMDAGPAPVRRRRKWAFAPATYVLLVINLLVFLPMALNPDINDLVLAHGANWGVGEVQYGQWWRVFTSMFIHYGYIHIATNRWCLWNLGLLGEPLLGSWGLIAVYLLTGLGGSLLSTAVHPSVTSVGASGAIFGLAGVLIMLLNSKLLPVPPAELKRLRRSVIWFAALNLVIGGGIWLAHTPLQIDNMAHLGGLLSGLALGLLLVPRIGAPRGQFKERQRLAFGGGALALLLFAYGIYKFHLS